MTTESQAAAVIEAMRSKITEADNWTLGEALQRAIPSGSTGFSDLLDRAANEGVAGKLSANTLRIYRDVVNQWPSSKRVAGVSFSAHREGMRNLNDVDAATKIIADIAANLGPDKVTVKRVREAIAAKTQSAVNKAPAQPSVPNRTVDVLADIKDGSPKIIAAIIPTTEVETLDKLNAGLKKALAHVERLQSKAARKAAPRSRAAAPAAAPAAPAASTPTAAPTTEIGDMRDL